MSKMEFLDSQEAEKFANKEGIRFFDSPCIRFWKIDINVDL